MADRTGIEWADATWTPIRARYSQIQNDGSGKERLGWHCEHVSEACRFCYAERLNLHLGTGREFKPAELYREERRGHHNGEVTLFLDDKVLSTPLRWRRPRLIFPCSMTDAFADFVPDAWLDRMLAIAALSPRHRFLFLTKRAGRLHRYFTSHDVGLRWHKAAGQITAPPDCPVPFQRFLDISVETVVDWTRYGLSNVWLGVSIEDQQTADDRIPLLLNTPAAVHFVSAEPLLATIDLRRLNIGPELYLDALTGAHFAETRISSYTAIGSGNWQPPSLPPRRAGLDLVIDGGESGPKARGTPRYLYRSLRDQCAAAGVAYFHKQNGEWIDADELLDDIRAQHGAVILKRGLDCPEDWLPDRPLNYADAAQLAGARRYEHHSDGSTLIRVGRETAGRLLDGREHSEMPS